MAGEGTVNEQRVTYGTTDVFHDLGLPDADELLAKSDLAIAIAKAIEALGISEAQAAKRIGISPEAMGGILRGQFVELSTENVLSYLLRLGLDVDVVIHQDRSPVSGSGTMKIAYL